MTDLLPKVESAFYALLNVLAVNSQFSVYQGKGNLDKDGNVVVAWAERGEEAVADTGNYEVEVTVLINWAPSTTAASLADSNSATGAVHEILFDTALAANLTAAATDFTCFGVTTRSLSADQKGDCWVEEVHLKILCCASDIG